MTFSPVEVSEVVKPVRQGAMAVEGKALVQEVKGHIFKAVASQGRLTTTTQRGTNHEFHKDGSLE